jgi:hypothetical protein
LSQQIAELYAKITADASGFKKELTDSEKLAQAWSAEMTKQGHAYSAVQKQKETALAEMRRAEEEAANTARKSAEEQIRKAKEVADAEKREANESAEARKNSILAIRAAADLARMALEGLKKSYDFAKAGAQTEFAALKFDRLAATIGTTGDALKDKLMVATKGTMSEMQVMASATDLVSLGLVKTEADTIRLSSVVAGLGMDMNQLVLALSNQTTMRFDQLGVAGVGFDEKVKALEATGMSAQDAFTEAFLQQAEEQLLKVGNAADTSLGQFLRFEAAGSELKATFQKLAAVVLLPALPGLTEDLKAATWQAENFGAIASEMWRIWEDGNKVGGLFGLIQLANNQALAEGNIKIQQFTEGLDSSGVSYRAMAEAAENGIEPIESSAGAMDDGGKAAEAFSAAAENFIGTLGQIGGPLQDYNDGLTDVNQNFTDSGFVSDLYKQRLDELLQTYRNGTLSQQEYMAGVKELQTGYQDGTFAAQEQQKAVDDLAAEYEAAKNKIVLSIVEMKLAQDGWSEAELSAYLNVGQKLGVFTEDQVNAAAAAVATADQIVAGYAGIESTASAASDATQAVLDTATQAGDGLTAAGAGAEVMAEGVATVVEAAADGVEPVMHIGERAEDAAENFGKMATSAEKLGNSISKSLTPAIAGLKSSLLSLPPEIFVDIYIRTHGGGGGNLPGGIGNGGAVGLINQGVPESVAQYLTGGGSSNSWTGGPLNMAGGTFVGDGPGGMITPYTEYISNGYVYSAKETRALLAAGMIKNPHHAMFGGEIESPKVIGGWTNPTPPRAGGDDRGGNNNGNGSTTSGNVEQEQDAFVQSVAGQVTATIQSAAQASNAAEWAQVSEQSQLVELQTEANQLLRELINQTPSGADNARANKFLQSLNS